MRVYSSCPPDRKARRNDKKCGPECRLHSVSKTDNQSKQEVFGRQFEQPAMLYYSTLKYSNTMMLDIDKTTTPQMLSPFQNAKTKLVCQGKAIVLRHRCPCEKTKLKYR